MTTQMNPEVKTKLVSALRSGKYKQGRTYLKREDCFCILGVVTDLYYSEVLQEAYAVEDDTILDCRIRDWAGFDYNFGSRITINAKEFSLSTHNDNGATFAELADAIEAQL